MSRHPDPAVVDWVSQRARRFPIDPDEVTTASPDEAVALPAATRSAVVVGLAVAVRSARELVLASHRITRALVHAGFRAVSIEGTGEIGEQLDRYVTSGTADAASLVAAAQGFLRTAETVEFVRWLREFNLAHPDDPVRVVPSDVEPFSERALGERILGWHSSTGACVVHLGGIAHTIAADSATVAPYDGLPRRTAGALLRNELGDRYQVLGLTAGGGHAPFPVPETPPDFTEAVFAEPPAPAVLLDLHGDPRPPGPVVRWLRSPLRTRFVGPWFDPANHAEHHVTAGPVADVVDALLHVARITPTTPL